MLPALFQGTGVGSGSALGVYIFTSSAAKDHTGPAIVLSALGVGVVSWIVGSCYSELACRIPLMGSCYLYSYTVFGEIVAFIVAWNLVLEALITVALAAQSLSHHLDVLADGQLDAWLARDLGRLPWDTGISPDIIALCVIALLAAASICRFKNLSLAVQTCLFILHMLVIIAMIFLTMFHVNPDNWGTDENFFRLGPQGVIAGAALLMASFSGIKSVAMAAEEVRKPSRNIPIAHTLTVVIISLSLFILSSFTTLSLPAERFTDRAPLLTLFESLRVRNAKYFIAVGCVSGLLLVISMQLQYTERLLFAMARDKLLPRKFFGWTYRTNTPWFCRLVVAFLAGVIALLVPFQCLLETVSISVLIAFALTCMAVVMLHYDPCQIGLGKGNPLRKSISAESFIVSRVSSQLSDATTNSEVSQTVSATLKETSVLLLTAEKGTTMYSVDKFPAIEPEAPSPSSSEGLPDLRTYRRVVKAINLSVVFSFGLGASVRFGQAAGEPLGWLSLAASLTFIFLNMCCSLYMYRAPCNGMPLVYSTGGMPFLPIAAVMCLCVMMLHLPLAAWIRWTTWSFIGMFVYLFYSRKRSAEGVVIMQEVFFENQIAMQAV